jgi:hypothetical protein
VVPGDNSHGQAGYGDEYNRGDASMHIHQLLDTEMGRALPFVNLGIGKSVAFAAAGGLHSCAALRTPSSSSTVNELKCWGMHSPSHQPCCEATQDLAGVHFALDAG